MKHKEDIKTEMKMIDGRSFNGISNVNNTIYFNRNNFVSDTKGDLKGTVYYV